MAVSQPMSVGAAPRARRGLFLLGTAMALAAFILVVVLGLFVSSRGGSAPGRVIVAVAARDIQAREPIDAGAVTLQPVSGPAPPGAITDLSQLKGKAAEVTILKGQAVTGNLVGVANEPVDATDSAYLPIPEGFVAVTIPTGEQQGVAGYIAAGDYINVVATVSTATFGANPARVVTKTTFTSLRVIRVGPAPVTAGAQAAQRQGVTSSLTVVVTACDAEFLDWLLTNTTVRYELLSYKDYLPTPAAADPACPALKPTGGIGPAQVDARFGFTHI